jgi:hypothetical protein
VTGDYQKISSESSLDNLSPITFRIENGSESISYLDLHHSLLYVKARTLHEDGTALIEADEVAPAISADCISRHDD